MRLNTPMALLIRGQCDRRKKRSLFVQTTLRNFQIILTLQNKTRVIKVIKREIHRNIFTEINITEHL